MDIFLYDFLMFVEFEKEKLQKANFVALLKTDELDNAIKEYEKYKKKLKNNFFYKIFKNRQYLEDVNELKKTAVQEFSKCAEKNYKEKKYYNALNCYKIVFDIDKENLDNLNKYIACLGDIEQYDLQYFLAKKLIKLNKTASNLKLFSKIAGNYRKYDEAIKYYNKYLEQDGKKLPDATDYNQIGCIYFNSYINNGENPKDAILALNNFEEAIKYEKNSKIYLKNAILAATKAKNWNAEKTYWYDYIYYGYMSKEDEFTYSASCLRNGDIESWAKYYNSRFEKTSKTIYPEIKKPLWNGEDIKNKTLLVHFEQGFGDSILMFGYMKRLTLLAKKVIFVVQNNLADLFKENSIENLEVLSQKETKLDKLKFDYHIPSMSIPIALRLNKENISVIGNYIKPNEKLANEYREKYFKTKKYKIGLAFLGHESNKKRDIPYNILFKLDKLSNVEFYCLTKDVADEKLSGFKRNKIINIAKNFSTFSDTAAVIKNMDIVISSDNCVLNLAGAIGMKTIGIFNYHHEFRWYDLNEIDCGWYKSVKPVVNNEYNDWNLSIQKVIDEVKSEISK